MRSTRRRAAAARGQVNKSGGSAVEIRPATASRWRGKNCCGSDFRREDDGPGAYGDVSPAQHSNGEGGRKKPTSRRGAGTYAPRLSRPPRPRHGPIGGNLDGTATTGAATYVRRRVIASRSVRRRGGSLAVALGVPAPCLSTAHANYSAPCATRSVP
jgi:hypothetical protein